MPSNARLKSQSPAASSVGGPGKGYISGMQMTFQGARAMTVTAGGAMLPNGTYLDVPTDLVKTGIALAASTFTHVYLYSNAGVADLEFSTTAPVKYFGTAYQKTGDTSRRYVGSLLANSGSNMYKWRHDLVKSTLTYIEGNSVVVPFLLLSAYGGTTPAPLVTSGMAPPQTTTHIVAMTNVNGLAYYFLAEQTQAPSAGTFMQVVGSQGQTFPTIIRHEIEVSREPATQGQIIIMGAGPAPSLTIFGYGYVFER